MNCPSSIAADPKTAIANHSLLQTLRSPKNGDRALCATTNEDAIANHSLLQTLRSPKNGDRESLATTNEEAIALFALLQTKMRSRIRRYYKLPLLPLTPHSSPLTPHSSPLTHSPFPKTAQRL